MPVAAPPPPGVHLCSTSANRRSRLPALYAVQGSRRGEGAAARHLLVLGPAGPCPLRDLPAGAPGGASRSAAAPIEYPSV